MRTYFCLECPNSYDDDESLYCASDRCENPVRLLHGDCLELMKDIPDGSVDMILTDPPYGINFRSGRRKDRYEKIIGDFTVDYLDDFFSECDRVLRDDSAIYCFCSWHNVDAFKTAFCRQFKLKNILVWVKNNHGSGDLRAGFAPRHEFILYGNKGRRFFSESRKDDVLFANKTGNKFHPTEKPVDLLELLIRQTSSRDDIVLDPFM